MLQDHMRKEDAFAHYSRGEYSEAFSGLKEWADAGDVDALIAVGWMQECGLGTTRNHSKAREYYKLAAEFGSVNATYRLGLLLISEQNWGDAKTVLKSGMNKGSISCMFQLGMLLVESPDADEDVDRGWSLIRQAADRGNIFAKRKWWSLEWRNSSSLYVRLALLIGLVPLFLEGVREIIRDPNSEKVF